MMQLVQKIDELVYNSIVNYITTTSEELSEEEKIFLEVVLDMKNKGLFSVAVGQALVETDNVVIRKDQL